MPPPSAVAARRRARGLRADSKPEIDAVTRFLSSLELPGGMGRHGPTVGWGIAGLLVLASISGGPGVLVVTLLALAVGVRILRRGAPARRDAAIDRDLPVALEAVARHLRGGGSLAQAISGARPPVDGALADHWDRLVADVSTMGVVAALDRWTTADARPTRPAEFLAAAALALAAETGGSPARAVDGVAATLRSRVALNEEIRALSSQARASAMVIGAAPLVFGALAGITDGRTAAYFRSAPGLVLLVAGIGLDALGLFWMMRLCRPPA